MNPLKEFLEKESSAGIILIFVTIAALLLKNSFLSEWYDSFLHTPVEIRFGEFQIAKPLLLWINDGLMAVFFFLIGLEVKREVLEGHLSSLSQAALPGFAAVGGMLIPALIYVFINKDGDAFALKGWAIPTATDIAFALGILSLLGKRVPVSLKILLLALAIIDDLGAIVIIALFYTSNLSLLSISLAAVFLSVLIIFNFKRVNKRTAYVLVGILLWASVLKSGVHATLAGVALAFTIPIKAKDENGNVFSPLKQFEHELHYWVAFLVLPLFAFVNAGLDVSQVKLTDMLEPVPLGIFMGLFFGKQLGVFGLSWIAIKLGWAKLPKGSNFGMLYGLSALTGIGFTMSLFVNSLAFEDSPIYGYADKMSILLASLTSGLLGYLIIKWASKKRFSD